MMSLRNSVTVESPYGLRTFALRFGDVTLASDAVLVVPTHANEDYEPEGRVLKKVSEDFKVDFHEVEKIVSGRHGVVGTFRICDKGSFAGKEILLVRIPGSRTGAAFSENPLELLSESLWSLFGSLAALELRNTTLTTLAMPLLAGSRGYQAPDLLEVILNHSLAWLRVSRYMSAVNFYLPDSELAQEWDRAMDAVLGRHSIDSAQNAVISALRAEILSLLSSKRISKVPVHWKDVLDELHSSLQLKRIPLERVAVNSRRVAELIVYYLLTNPTAIPPKGSLHSQIKSLADQKSIAPWIVAHLECLKNLGNAGAHSNEDVSYDPPTLRDDDLVGILASLHRVLEFVIQRFEKQA